MGILYNDVTFEYQKMKWLSPNVFVFPVPFPCAWITRVIIFHWNINISIQLMNNVCHSKEHLYENVIKFTMKCQGRLTLNNDSPTRRLRHFMCFVILFENNKHNNKLSCKTVHTSVIFTMLNITSMERKNLRYQKIKTTVDAFNNSSRQRLFDA